MSKGSKNIYAVLEVASSGDVSHYRRRPDTQGLQARLEPMRRGGFATSSNDLPAFDQV